MFKLKFPSGYNIDDVSNENIDINVYMPNGDIFFATLFTLNNIAGLMQKDRSVCFWSDSMIIVQDLEKATIKASITAMIEDGYLHHAFSNIGNMSGANAVYKSYESLKCDL